MGRYASEPENATKSCKSRGSHLRVHFKVNIYIWPIMYSFLIYL